MRSIAGVSTSVTMFIGATALGPINRPTRFLNYSDVARAFGEDGTVSDLPRQVKLFFLNGGSDCYVMRIAQGAAPATMQLLGEDGAPKLALSARQEGAAGDRIRTRVSYDAANPEAEFNMEIWRSVPLASGGTSRAEVETFRNLSMDPASPNFAPAILTQRSKRVTATDLSAAPGVGGSSIAGHPIPYTDATPGTVQAALDLVMMSHGALRLRIGTRAPIDVPGLDQVPAAVAAAAAGAPPATGAAMLALYAQHLTAAINAGLAATGETVTADFLPGPLPPVAEGDASALLQLTADSVGVDLRVLPAPAAADMAMFLMLGAGQGGLEPSAFAGNRPAPNGIALDPIGGAWGAIMAARQDAITEIRLPERQAAGGWAPSAAISVDLVTTAAADPIWRATADAWPNDHAGGYLDALGTIRDAINTYRTGRERTFPWSARVVGLRLLIEAVGEEADLFTGAIVTNAAGGAGTGLDLGPLTTQNTRNAMLGTGGITGFQVPGAAGDDGAAPTQADYEAAFPIIDREVDLFNLMVLPPTHGSGLDMADVYRPASIFCQRRRAFLIMDAPVTWATAQAATAGVTALKTGLVKDHAALYYPRLRIAEAGRNHFVGAGGAMAGVMARIDGSRGVWKAPAGIEADIRGINGLEYPFSDMEHGTMNPRAINVVRSFPTGIVSWGARTMDGDDDTGSEYKYIPIRRLALNIEESLYRGLKWVVFEPNDEPLWAQIRMNVGSYMHGLFRQGAFQGRTKSDAYFVKCDAETTPQADRDLGRVNIWVGFAPLKPAEFVILYLQQIAGALES